MSQTQKIKILLRGQVKVITGVQIMNEFLFSELYASPYPIPIK